MTSERLTQSLLVCLRRVRQTSDGLAMDQTLDAVAPAPSVAEVERHLTEKG